MLPTLAEKGTFMSVPVLKTLTILEREAGNEIRSQLKYLGNEETIFFRGFW